MPSRTWTVRKQTAEQHAESDRLANLPVEKAEPKKGKVKVTVEEATPTEYVMPGTDPQTGRALPFYKRHSGSFRLVVTRPFATKAGFYRSQWLPGLVEGEDVESDAMALLKDKRDTIEHVGVYSVKDEMFVMSYERGRK